MNAIDRPATDEATLSRGNFLAASGAFVLSFWVPDADAANGPKARPAKPTAFAPNAYVRIGTTTL